MLTDLLPDGVVVWATRTSEPGDPLHPEEEVFVRSAGPRRREEFRLGRACARRALAELGVLDAPVGVSADRAPVWPPGTVGSITHCEGFCAAAVTWAHRHPAVGIDVELNRPLPDGVAEAVCASDELSDAERAFGRIGGAALVFSAKESLFKAWSPLTGRWLGFDDARVRLDPACRTFTAELTAARVGRPPWFPQLVHGRYAFDEQVVLTAVVLSHAQLGAR